MYEIDLKQLSYVNLLYLQKQLEVEIVNRKSVEAARVKEKLTTIAEREGFNLTELVIGRKSMICHTIKYKNPKNPKQIWTGRGRRPTWLVEALKKGANLNQFSV